MQVKTFIRNLLVVVVIAIGFSSQSLAADGVVIKSTTYRLNGDAKSKLSSSTMYILGSKILIQQDGESGKEMSMIFDSSKNEMTIFINENEYMVIGEAELAAIKEQLNSMMGLMEQMKDQMPVEQRKQYEQQMKALKGEMPETTFKKTGTETINGKSANKYEAFTDNEKVGEFYVAEFSKFGVSKSDFAPLGKMMAFFQEQLAGLSNNFQMSGGETNFLAMSGDNPMFNSGVPMKVTTFSKGKASTDTVIDDVQKKSIDANMFKIPANMKKTSIQQMMQGGINR